MGIRMPLGQSLVSANDMMDDGALNLAIAIVDAAKKDYCGIDGRRYCSQAESKLTILNWTQTPSGSAICLNVSRKEIQRDWDRLDAHLDWRAKMKCHKCQYGKKHNCVHQASYKHYHKQKCLRGEEVKIMEMELGKWLDLQAEAAHKWSYNGSMGVNADEIGVKVYGLDRMAEIVMKKIRTEKMENGETVRFIKWKRVRFYEPIEGEKDA